MEPHVGLCAGWGACLGFSLLFPLPLSAPWNKMKQNKTKQNDVMEAREGGMQQYLGKEHYLQRAEQGQKPWDGVCLTCSSWGKGDSMPKAGEAEERIKRAKNNEKAYRSVT